VVFLDKSEIRRELQKKAIDEMCGIFAESVMTGVGVATHAEIQGGGPNHKLFQEDIAVSNFLDQKFPWKWSGRGGHCNLVTSSSPYRLLIAHSDDTSATLLGCDIAHCSARTSCEDGYTRNLYKYVG